jgi:hypothetical protein
MLDMLCTFYDPTEIHKQVEMFDGLDKDKYKFYYVCNWENQSDVIEHSKKANVEIYWLDSNPSQHIGAHHLLVAGGKLLDNKYVVHYHADMIFNDIDKLEKMIKSFIDSKKDVASIPRQWCFDNNNKFIDNKSIPFRSEVFMMKTNLYKKVFDEDYISKRVQHALSNGHNSGPDAPHFEAVVYAGLELNNINFYKDIHYLISVEEMKKIFGNQIVYYNTVFGDTGIWRSK